MQYEKSPYLLQHAKNPVDWYPWGEEAFERARQEEKPIFLSIGYSTCYWCHVMEREVFENTDIAEQMNRLFVNIKVDREERPDVDRIYMIALQSMTESGGWPMSMFLTPDRKPFYGATYIPPSARYGRAGFPEVIERLSDAWATRRAEVEQAGEKLRTHLAGMRGHLSSDAVPTADVLRTGRDAFANLYDAALGGFGGAPKFPRPAVVNFLFRYADRAADAEARAMALQTLDRMHAGGMYDHIGGGFHRYATDAEWHVPHFEKMLYDQAQLVIAYVEAFQVTQHKPYAEIARDVLRYVMEVLRSPDGGFYSAEDAESIVDEKTGQKKEGAFYVWTQTELVDVLSDDELRMVKPAYDIHPDGNVSHDPHAEFMGKNVLRLMRTPEQIAAEAGTSPDVVRSHLDRARDALRARRSLRSRPHLDDKILASWNGMMICAFAKAATAFDDRTYLEVATRAMGFVLKTLTDGSGRLFRRFRDGEARYAGGLEDYAWMITACLDLYDATFDASYIERALLLTDQSIQLFSDHDLGGFFDTVGDDETLIARMKESYDGAEPSGNAVMACAMLRLADMLHAERYRNLAGGILRSLAAVLTQAPQAAPQLLVALDHELGPARQIVLVGEPGQDGYEEMSREIRSRFLPRTAVIALSPDTSHRGLFGADEFLSSLGGVNDRPTVYLCTDFTCDLPITDAGELRKALDE